MKLYLMLMHALFNELKIKWLTINKINTMPFSKINIYSDELFTPSPFVLSVGTKCRSRRIKRIRNFNWQEGLYNREIMSLVNILQLRHLNGANAQDERQKCTIAFGLAILLFISTPRWWDATGLSYDL